MLLRFTDGAKDGSIDGARVSLSVVYGLGLRVLETSVSLQVKSKKVYFEVKILRKTSLVISLRPRRDNRRFSFWSRGFRFIPKPH